MKFGPVPLAAAEGALLAHSVTLAKGRLKKGQLLTRENIAALAASGARSVIVAQLEPGDVHENEAARRLAAALAAPHLTPGTPGTGRCNLYAAAAGLLLIDAERVHRLNLVHEAITLATAFPFDTLAPGRIAATVKIIPFAAPDTALEQCLAIARERGPMLCLAPFRKFRAGLIQTRLPGVKKSVLEKTVAVTRARLEAIGSQLAAHRICEHDAAAVTNEIAALAGRCDVLLLLGASAIIDRRDVIPSAIGAAGGAIVHFGMPVDPGNLTLLARIGGMPVLGLPGSARSPRVHGFDFVLQRLAAGLDVTGSDMMRMGVGGLLKEIAGRPLPRARAAPAPVVRARGAPRIAAVVLAAGRATRMRGTNKLLAHIGDRPLVRHVVERIVAARPSAVVVVTGHERERTEAALAGLDVRFADNPDYAAGLGTSLRAGISALGGDIDGALICLGDMPEISPALIGRMIAAFAPEQRRDIVVPVHSGRRGNPVLLGRRHFAAAAAIDGDKGARELIAARPSAVVEVAADSGALLDLDTPEAFASYASRNDGNAKTAKRQETT